MNEHRESVVREYYADVAKIAKDECTLIWAVIVAGDWNYNHRPGFGLRGHYPSYH